MLWRKRLAFELAIDYLESLFPDHLLMFGDTIQIVSGILQYWPYGSHQKELAFLQELDDLFEFMEPEDFAVIQDQLFDRIKQLLEAPHFQV